MSSILFHSIQLNNFLSFGEKSRAIELKALNIIIGANGSGKSNLLEAFELLRNAPEQIVKPIRQGGGVNNFLWKGAKDTPIAYLGLSLSYKENDHLEYKLRFTEEWFRFKLLDEVIGGVTWNSSEWSLEQSILSLLRDPKQYPEITYLAKVFSQITLYRDWTFGRHAIPRHPQKTDLPNYTLEPDASNLGLVLNRFSGEPAVKRRVIKALRDLYPSIEDYFVLIEGGTVQVFFLEGDFKIPATRLSDGTLRYLCLLAILCNPTPPPLICIEEPELGLHPDVLPTLAELLKEASERTQLIITTHSDILVDAMSDCPEAILVAEKTENGTTMTRLNADKLKPWLEKYRLGQLWKSGEIGGTRW